MLQKAIPQELCLPLGNFRTKRPVQTRVSPAASLQIVFVSSESCPHSKTGGLGDVLQALPANLSKRGHRVMTVSPRYAEYHDAYDSGLVVPVHSGMESSQTAFCSSTQLVAAHAGSLPSLPPSPTAALQVLEQGASNTSTALGFSPSANGISTTTTITLAPGSSTITDKSRSSNFARLFVVHARGDGVDRVLVDHPLFQAGSPSADPSSGVYTYSHGISKVDQQARNNVLCQAAISAPVLLWGLSTSAASLSYPLGVRFGLARPAVLSLLPLSAAVRRDQGAVAALVKRLSQLEGQHKVWEERVQHKLVHLRRRQRAWEERQQQDGPHHKDEQKQQERQLQQQQQQQERKQGMGPERQQIRQRRQARLVLQQQRGQQQQAMQQQGLAHAGCQLQDTLLQQQQQLLLQELVELLPPEEQLQQQVQRQREMQGLLLQQLQKQQQAQLQNLGQQQQSLLGHHHHHQQQQQQQQEQWRDQQGSLNSAAQGDTNIIVHHGSSSSSSSMHASSQSESKSSKKGGNGKLGDAYNSSMIRHRHQRSAREMDRSSQHGHSSGSSNGGSVSSKGTISDSLSSSSSNTAVNGHRSLSAGCTSSVSDSTSQSGSSSIGGSNDNGASDNPDSSTSDPIIFVGNDWPTGLLPLWLETYQELAQQQQQQQQQYEVEQREQLHPRAMPIPEPQPSHLELQRQRDVEQSHQQQAQLQVPEQQQQQPSAAGTPDQQSEHLSPLEAFQAYLGSQLRDRTHFVTTIHNFAYQGLFPVSTFSKLGLPPARLEQLLIGSQPTRDTQLPTQQQSPDQLQMCGGVPPHSAHLPHLPSQEQLLPHLPHHPQESGQTLCPPSTQQSGHSFTSIELPSSPLSTQPPVQTPVQPPQAHEGLVLLHPHNSELHSIQQLPLSQHQQSPLQLHKAGDMHHTNSSSHSACDSDSKSSWSNSGSDVASDKVGSDSNDTESRYARFINSDGKHSHSSSSSESRLSNNSSVASSSRDGRLSSMAGSASTTLSSGPPGAGSKISWLQASLLCSDLILTVSPTHAAELLQQAREACAEQRQADQLRLGNLRRLWQMGQDEIGEQDGPGCKGWQVQQQEHGLLHSQGLLQVQLQISQVQHQGNQVQHQGSQVHQQDRLVLNQEDSHMLRQEHSQSPPSLELTQQQQQPSLQGLPKLQQVQGAQQPRQGLPARRQSTQGLPVIQQQTRSPPIALDTTQSPSSEQQQQLSVPVQLNTGSLPTLQHTEQQPGQHLPNWQQIEQRLLLADQQQRVDSLPLLQQVQPVQHPDALHQQHATSLPILKQAQRAQHPAALGQQHAERLPILQQAQHAQQPDQSLPKWKQAEQQRLLLQETLDQHQQWQLDRQQARHKPASQWPNAVLPQGEQHTQPPRSQAPGQQPQQQELQGGRQLQQHAQPLQPQTCTQQQSPVPPVSVSEPPPTQPPKRHLSGPQQVQHQPIQPPKLQSTQPLHAATGASGPQVLGALGACHEQGLAGILNGLDTSVWCPWSDVLLPRALRYTAADASYKKAQAKALLQGRLGLRVCPSTPLFGFVGRLDEQKGVDIVLAALPHMLGPSAMHELGRNPFAAQLALPIQPEQQSALMQSQQQHEAPGCPPRTVQQQQQQQLQAEPEHSHRVLPDRLVVRHSARHRRTMVHAGSQNSRTGSSPSDVGGMAERGSSPGGGGSSNHRMDLFESSSPLDVGDLWGGALESSYERHLSGEVPESGSGTHVLQARSMSEGNGCDAVSDQGLHEACSSQHSVPGQQAQGHKGQRQAPQGRAVIGSLLPHGRHHQLPAPTTFQQQSQVDKQALRTSHLHSSHVGSQRRASHLHQQHLTPSTTLQPQQPHQTTPQAPAGHQPSPPQPPTAQPSILQHSPHRLSAPQTSGMQTPVAVMAAPSSPTQPRATHNSGRRVPDTQLPKAPLDPNQAQIENIQQQPPPGASARLAQAPEFAPSPFQAVLLGTGEPWMEHSLSLLHKAWPGACVGYPSFNEPLAHLLMAAADYLLVPSRFEPCGLVALCALRYGTPPLVTPVGGLLDIVQPQRQQQQQQQEGVGQHGDHQASQQQQVAQIQQPECAGHQTIQQTRPVAIATVHDAHQPPLQQPRQHQAAPNSFHRQSFRPKSKVIRKGLVNHDQEVSSKLSGDLNGDVGIIMDRLGPAKDAAAVRAGVAALVAAMYEAVDVYGGPSYRAMQARGMARDVSWEGPAAHWEAALMELVKVA